MKRGWFGFLYGKLLRLCMHLAMCLGAGSNIRAQLYRKFS